ncbi:hypothetical protein EVAR_58982_1 [Eumeta japonica]|uniref:Uncharacterized protein n=1 Tax=Eumeta variegata TaxID=151549 RepID=A0A4C1YDM4_EUMVA|nr:hypothetical protein EVAR_58982_1 [Eumeta japonica]
MTDESDTERKSEINMVIDAVGQLRANQWCADHAMPWQRNGAKCALKQDAVTFNSLKRMYFLWLFSRNINFWNEVRGLWWEFTSRDRTVQRRYEVRRFPNAAEKEGSGSVILRCISFAASSERQRFVSCTASLQHYENAMRL